MYLKSSVAEVESNDVLSMTNHRILQRAIVTVNELHFLLKDNFLDGSKLKAFADDKCS